MLNLLLIGTQIAQVPVVMRQPLDLFKFYTVVQERGGLQEVSFVKPLLFADIFLLFITAVLTSLPPYHGGNRDENLELRIPLCSEVNLRIFCGDKLRQSV